MSNWQAGPSSWRGPSTRVPVVLSQKDRARIACQVRSGDGVDRADAELLLDTIESLEAIIVRQAQRVEDVAPGQVGAQVESQVPDDPARIGRRS